jgi:hypothetical protein
MLGAFLVVALVVFVTGGSSAVAATPGPGWSITSVAQPTNFSSSETQDTVEELVVSATGGTYELKPSHSAIATVPIEWDAPASKSEEVLGGPESVEKALEVLSEVGDGNVSVTGGPGDATGSNPYTVTWVGALTATSPGGLIVTEEHLTNGVGAGTAARTRIQEGKANDRYTLLAVNTRSRSTEGEVTITDTLPGGLVPTEMTVEEPRTYFKETCAVTVPLKCVYDRPIAPVRPGGELRVRLYVAVASAAVKGTLVNQASVSGGGGVEAKTSETTAVNVGPAPFGIDQLAFDATGLEGGLDMQAGDHPYAVTTRLDFNTVFAGLVQYRPAREVKDVAVELPLGFAGDPLAAERCPEIDLTDATGEEGIHTRCMPGSRVGTVRFAREGGLESAEKPIYNVVPEHGFPAELGFVGVGQPVLIYASVVPGRGGYRLRLATPGVLRAGIEAISVMIFGGPGEHNGTGGAAAFIANPSSCSGELTVRAEVTAWEGGSDTKEATAYPSITGCDLLTGSASFSPSVEVQPETTQADTPSGYEVDLKVPQAPNLFGALATSDLKNATVTLPAGVSVSPSAASGPNALEGCTAEQIDLLGTELGEGHPGGDGSPYDDGLTHASPGHCPEHSRIGEVEVRTPVLEEALRGHVYLAEPHCGQAGQSPCTEAEAEAGKVFGLYMEMAGSGVIIKLAGSVEVGGYGGHNNLAVGQLRARFDENPQFPFEDLKMTFSGGQRAPLANPQSCGTFTTTSGLEPWSAPESGPNATPSWPFAVTGCGGGFAPSFSAGAVTPLAGAFSPFTLTFWRQDREQDLSGLTVTMPPGLLGALKGVEQCPEPQASRGECGPGSLVGHDQVAAGSGSQPLWETGQVFLTGPYKGAPFGLSIVTPAVAGPFNLGNVVVRAAIAVNPVTSQITTTSDPLPQEVDGVPLRIKTVNVTIDGVGGNNKFIFNPTNCDAQAVAGTITSAQGAVVGVSSPFAAAGCANLPFKPHFSASTTGKTSKALGATLKVKIASAGIGQADIAKVDVEIPKALPTQLKTLNHACTEAQFNSNPANCPPASNVAQVTVQTPLLNGVGGNLSGPAYLVSHGGAAFPDVEMVLQGENKVELVIDGKTQIKKGITYSHFETVPDAPFTSFEFNSPQGELALFTANGDLCDQKLVMPTTMTGQNGAVLKQNTPVEVEGCSATVAISSHTIKRRTLTGKVYVPAAGKVKVSGKGLTSETETAKGRETLTFKLHQKRAGRLTTTLRVHFTPTTGKVRGSQVKTLRLRFRT